MKARRLKRAALREFHHNVYVVLLSPDAARHSIIRRVNPKRDPKKPCVYVGMTGLDPEERFLNHKNGYKAAWVVEKDGVRLLREMYECFNSMPFEARFGIGEVVRPKANLHFLAQQLAEDEFDRAFEIPDRDILVDVKAFDLLKSWIVRSVGIVAPINAARSDNADGRGLAFHHTNLH